MDKMTQVMVASKRSDLGTIKRRLEREGFPTEIRIVPFSDSPRKSGNGPMRGFELLTTAEGMEMFDVKIAIPHPYITVSCWDTWGGSL